MRDRCAECLARGLVERLRRDPFEALIQFRDRLGGVAHGVAKVAINEGMRESSLLAREFEPVRLEFGTIRSALAQRLPLCNERAHLFL